MDTFYFGRLNFIGKRNLWDLLNAKHIYRKNNGLNFGIFELEKIRDKDLGLVYVGELIKYADYIAEDVVKKGKPDIEYIKGSIRGRSRFFLTESDHIICYNPYGRIVSDKAFKSAFSAILIAADDSMEVDSLIYPINSEHEFSKFLKTKMKLIRKITFTLTPSNPSNRDEWKDVDDKLNEMNAKSYKEEIVAKDGKSLQLQDEEYSKIEMASDGYGTARVEGIDKNRQNVTISTNKKQNILRKSISKLLTVKEQLKSLETSFKDIGKRFKKNKK